MDAVILEGGSRGRVAHVMNLRPKLMIPKTAKDLLTAILPRSVIYRISYVRYRGVADTLFEMRRRLRFWWRRRKLPSGVMPLTGNIRIAVDDSEDFLSFCHRDADCVREFESFARLTQNKRCLLDVGALFGFFSLYFTANPNRTAHSVEPSPASCDRLKRLAELNERENIEVVNLAFGAERGDLRMLPGPHFVAAPHGAANGASMLVPQMRLDDYVEEMGLAPDVMKIDVEGFEYEVVQGARQTLSRHRPLIFLELHPTMLPALGHEVADVLELLREHGYQFYDSKLRPVAAGEIVTHADYRIICRAKPNEGEARS